MADTVNTLAGAARSRPPGEHRDHYVGDDRRNAPTPVRPADLGVLAVVLGLIVAIFVVIRIDLLADGSLLAEVDTDTLATWLNATIAVLGTVVAVFGFMRWRLTGESRPLWVAAAALLLGTGAIGLGHLLPDVTSPEVEDSFLHALQPGARLAAVLFVVAAASLPQVDTRLTPRRLTIAAVAIATGIAATIHNVEAFQRILDVETSHTLFAAAWCAAAAAHTVTAVRRRRRDHLAVATAAVALALAEVARTLALGMPADAIAGAAFLEIVALGVLLSQGTRDLEIDYTAQRARLLDREVAYEAVNTRMRAEHAAHEERAHDAKNALFAIEGAARTLDRYRDHLDPERRAQLSEAVTAEIARLQTLIQAQRETEVCAPFSLAELITPITTSERARGMRLESDVPGDLVATGRPTDTAEAVRNLLDNARRYAPGSPVTLRGEIDGQWAVVYVEDRGRGIGREERGSIFERGRRGSSAQGTEGTGLGLFVSRRLMSDQGGDLWVENRPGGGARFGLCLPLVSGTGDDGIPELDVDIEPDRVGAEARDTTGKHSLR